MDDVLHGALGVEEPAPDLGRVVALGEQSQDGRLALREAREGEAARREDEAALEWIRAEVLELARAFPPPA